MKVNSDHLKDHFWTFLRTISPGTKMEPCMWPVHVPPSQKEQLSKISPACCQRGEEAWWPDDRHTPSPKFI